MALAQGLQSVAIGVRLFLPHTPSSSKPLMQAARYHGIDYSRQTNWKENKVLSHLQLHRSITFSNFPIQKFLPSLKMASCTSPPNDEAVAEKPIFDKGLEIRYEVASSAYVNTALSGGSSDFAWPMQELVTATCWGSVLSRPGLERKQCSRLNIAMLCALNRGSELVAHVRGAVNNGASKVGDQGDDTLLAHSATTHSSINRVNSEYPLCNTQKIAS